MKPKSDSPSGGGWYPGKLIKERRATLKAARTKSTSGGEASTDGGRGHPALAGIGEGDAPRDQGVTEGSRRRGPSPEVSVGHLSIKLIDTRFITAERPELEVIFDNQSEVSSFQPEQFRQREVVFPIGNITADINILLKEQYTIGSSSEVIGIVVLPLTRYIGVTQPVMPKVEWFEFYPFSELHSIEETVLLQRSSSAGSDSAEVSLDGSHNSIGEVVLRSGDPNIPGSAMNKNKHSLGFLCCVVEVFLSEPAYKLYLKSSHPDTKWIKEIESAGPSGALSPVAGPAPATDGESAEKVLLLPFDAETTYSLLQRLKRLAAMPALVAPMLSFPEVIILVILYGFLCFGTEIWHLPIIWFVIVLANGSLSALDDKYGHVIIWNRNESARKKTTKVDEFAKFKTLQPFFGTVQQKLSTLVTFLEKSHNLWNWSDPRCSLCAYGSLFAACLTVSVVARIIGIRIVLFLLGTLVLLHLSLSAVLLQNLKAYKASIAISGNEKEEPSDNAPAAAVEFRAKIANSMLLFAEMLSNFYARIPDSTTLEHRYIAGAAFVYEDEQEMKDAAEAYQRNKKKV